MQGPLRKVVSAALYEIIAIGVLSPTLAWAYDESLASSGMLSVLLSVSALLWNVLYNWAFEHWEARQQHSQRTWQRRLLHATGFEGGLTVLLLPLIAFWLDISWWQALVTNLALFAFFFLYALVFQWAFDRIFDVPDSAKGSSEPLRECKS